MNRRADKPTATAPDVQAILSQPTRKLTKDERKERVSFYDGGNVHAEAVEPAGNMRGRFGPRN